MPPRKGMTYLKTNCCGCKAMKDGLCLFRIPTERVVDPTTGYITIKPLRPCPKPRTKQKLRESLAAHTNGVVENPPYMGTP